MLNCEETAMNRHLNAEILFPPFLAKLDILKSFETNIKKNVLIHIFVLLICNNNLNLE